MKKNLKVYLSFIFMLQLCSSCSKEYYSCDQEVNNWVCNNLDNISKMTRKDWLEVSDVTYQRGIYNAFLVDQKINLWVGKIEELLGLNWSSAEKEHLIKLQVAIKENVNWFLVNCIEEEQDKKDMFMYQWIDYATNKLNWQKELIYSIAFTPEMVTDSKTLLSSRTESVSSIKTRSEGGGWKQDCNCHNPESAQYIICGKTGDDCFIGNCTETLWGCGWLWSEGCNGLCYRRT